MRKSTSGFTIVELLIVIVIIAILASITIVAYNGIQQRATFTKLQTELGVVRDALELYRAENGDYPATGGYTSPTWRYSCVTGISNFIPGLTAYIPNLPQAPCSGGATNNDTWLYGSDGIGYKLIHIRPNRNIASNVPIELRDQRYPSTSSWGYWTSDSASDWTAK